MKDGKRTLEISHLIQNLNLCILVNLTKLYDILITIYPTNNYSLLPPLLHQLRRKALRLYCASEILT